MAKFINLLRIHLFSATCALLLCLFYPCLATADWVEEQPLQDINENYYRLKKALDYYDSLQTHSWPSITTTDFTPGNANPAIPELRERLRLTGDLSEKEDTRSEVYDTALVKAVKRFQWRHGLAVDGILGSKTQRELNISPYERAEEIRRNMQRWAALPDKLGQRFIFINIPEYRFDLIDNGKAVLTMKVIVGKPDRPTPELTSSLTQIELNPYWNIPLSIAQKDIIPKIIKDPRYLDQMNIKVVLHKGSQVQTLNPNHINWKYAEENGFNYELRQEPGKNNALGLVKFDFVNEYDVYMHDTPAKDLFGKNSRAFSSGCIRLEKPFALLSYLLNSDPEWDIHRIAQILQSGKLTTIKVRPIPIYIIYATAWVDRNGVLNFRRDPYGYNEDPNPDDMNTEARIDDPFTIPLSFYA